MSRGVRLSLIAASYIYGFANGLAQTILVLRLSFCGPKEINHFYCADPPLLVLACSDTYVNETAMFVVAGSNLMFSLAIILISYIFIFYSHSANAFSRREAQGLLHLWVSSDSCYYVSWDTVLDVSEAAFSGICRADQNCSWVLYPSESYAKPFDLQPSEQRF